MTRHPRRHDHLFHRGSIRLVRQWWVEVLMQGLVGVSLAIFVAVEFLHPSPASTAWLNTADITVGLIFLFEFALRLHAARNRRRYFFRNWWLLLATLPFTGGSVQVLRLLRVAGHAAYTSETA